MISRAGQVLMPGDSFSSDCDLDFLALGPLPWGRPLALPQRTKTLVNSPKWRKDS